MPEAYLRLLDLPPLAHLLLTLMLVIVVLLPALACRPREMRGQAAAPGSRQFLGTYLVALGCGCLLLLSACGTAPLPAAPCPPVPAELLTPPQPPVMLQPPSPLKTPGPTTSETLRDAALTESTTSG